MSYYSKTNPCVIVFKIEDFSTLANLINENLHSCFDILGLKIYLKFYPRKDGQCCCFINIPNSGHLLINYSFELICNDNNMCSSEFEHEFKSRSETSEWKNFICYEDVLKYKDKYLVNDCLTLHILLWGMTLKLPNLKRILCYSKLLEKENCSLTWNIHDLKLSQVHLNSFHFSEGSHLVIKLMCSEDDDINILIEMPDFKNRFYLKTGICLITQLSDFAHVKIQYCHDFTEKVLKLPPFNIGHVSGREMCFKFKFSILSREARNEYKIDNNHIDSCSNISNAIEDFLFMFKNEINTDVCLQVSGGKLFAHKFVLISRSPVFRAMLEHDMLEKQNSVIDIEDISFDILKDFIYFLYGGLLETLNYVKSIELIKPAEKYQVFSLKKECSKFLESCLCEKNFCEILIISDMVHEKILKNACMEFFKNNRKNILNSKEWEKLSDSRKELTLEVLTIYAREM